MKCRVPATKRTANEAMPITRVLDPEEIEAAWTAVKALIPVPSPNDHPRGAIGPVSVLRPDDAHTPGPVARVCDESCALLALLARLDRLCCGHRPPTGLTSKGRRAGTKQ